MLHIAGWKNSNNYKEGFAVAGWRPRWLRVCPHLPRMSYRQIEAVNATVLPRGTLKIDRV